MDHSRAESELGLVITPSPETVPINGKCTLKKDGPARVVYVAGLAVHHWMNGDRMTEAYAMAMLVRCGYADQSEVVRAFGISRRTLLRQRQRFESDNITAFNAKLSF